MNLLLIHRQDETEKRIQLVMDIFADKNPVSLRDDEADKRTNSRSFWLYSIGNGFGMDGKPLYDVFVVLGDILDDIMVELLGLIPHGKLIYLISDNKLKLVKWNNIEYRFIVMEKK